MAPVPESVAIAYLTPWRLANASSNSLTWLVVPQLPPGSLALSIVSRRLRFSGSPKSHRGAKGSRRSGSPPSIASFSLATNAS